MDSQEFREYAKAAIDIIADYWDNIRNRYVIIIYLLKLKTSRILKN